MMAVGGFVATSCMRHYVKLGSEDGSSASS